MKVPFVDLGSQQSEIEDEVRLGLDHVFSRTAFVGGPEVTAFEKEYAAYVGAGHCVGVGNGVAWLAESSELPLLASTVACASCSPA